MYQLFALFMMTDPKTTVKSRMGQNAVAFSIALLEMFLRLNEAVYAPFYALFIIGPIALIIEDQIHQRKLANETKDEIAAARAS
jgi:Na+-translocating ferredoxin:NAD+ oxidoreductase RnfD subunit